MSDLTVKQIVVICFKILIFVTIDTTSVPILS